MPQLSIIIPFHSGTDALEETLVSVLANRPDDCEILVVHRGAYDDPYELAEEVRFVGVAEDAKFARALNVAFVEANGDVIHLLACGSEVEEGWTDAALPHFDDVHVASVTPLLMSGEQVAAAGLRASGLGMRIQCGEGLNFQSRDRSTLDPIGPTRHAAFYRRSVLHACGGMSEELSEHNADLELALEFRSLGYATRFEPDCQIQGNGVAPATINPHNLGREAQTLLLRYNSWLTNLTVTPLMLGIQSIASCWKFETWMNALGRIRASFDYRSFCAVKRQLDFPPENESINSSTKHAWHRVESEHQSGPATRSEKRQSA